MPFHDLVGNKPIKTYLTRMFQKGVMGNSYLFAGPESVGKSLFAERLAHEIIAQDDETGLQRQKLQSGNHPDLHIYRPEGKTGMHSIEGLRHLSEEVYLYPHEAKRKFFIIHDAERMLPTSANALLKTFEEPSPDAVIILISSAPQALLPTILSRCAKIHFKPVPEKEITNHLMDDERCGPKDAAFLARLSQGSIGKAITWAKEGVDPKRKEVLNFLAQEQRPPFTELQAFLSKIVSHIEKRRKNLEEALREQLAHHFGETKNLTAVQRQAIEKELEGALSMRTNEECKSVFASALSWFRDGHLLHVKGGSSKLFNVDYEEALQRFQSNGKLIPLEEVEKAVSDAQLALARSCTLNTCLETFFLRLEMGAGPA